MPFWKQIMPGVYEVLPDAAQLPEIPLLQPSNPPAATRRRLTYRRPTWLLACRLPGRPPLRRYVRRLDARALPY